MVDIRGAILNAVKVADQLHQEFETQKRFDDGEGRIDVFAMLVKYDILVMFQKLNGLLGAFLNEGGSQGVIVTTQRQLPVQRFTAAHELGHAVLGHSPSLDPRDILARSPLVSQEDGQYNVQEIQANMFAAELLVPRWLLVKHMARQRWNAENLKFPKIVYQLSLRLGTSYWATCHALFHHKIVTSREYQSLLSMKRKSIKEDLVNPYRPANWYGDVWEITERDDGIRLEGSRSDLVVLRIEEHSGAGYLWTLDELVELGLMIVEDQRTDDGVANSIGGFVFRTVIAESQDGAKGRASLKEIRP